MIHVYPADAYGSGSYRLIWPARALEAQGQPVRVHLPADRDGVGGDFDERTGKIVAARIPDDATAIVLQRVSMSRLGEAIPLIRAKGVAVIVDMDDDLTKIAPSNPAYWGFRKDTGHSQHNQENAARACRDATLVTVSTPRLIDVYGRDGRGQVKSRVLRNCVPERFLGIEHVEPDPISFGWPGVLQSHPLDLDPAGVAPARLIGEGFRYFAAGPDFAYVPGDAGLWRKLGVSAEQVERSSSSTAGNLAFEDYPGAVSRMGVGMAPLADTRFNHAKSWLKPLEMSALGVPWVASPLPEYAELHGQMRRVADDSVGLLAKQPRDWYRCLRWLLTDGHLRQAMSLAGRAAAAHFTIEANAWRWLEAWQLAIDIQQGRSSKITTNRG